MRLAYCHLPLLLLSTLLPAMVVAQSPGEPRPVGPQEPAGEKTPGEEPTAPQQDFEGRMPVRIVGGKLVVRCEVSTKFRRIPANFFVALDRPVGLELHNKAAKFLRCEEGAGVPLTIHIPGQAIEVARREHGDEEQLDDYTKLYSRDLGEVACIGTIGSKILGRYHVVVDVAEGFVRLSPPMEKSAEPPEDREGSHVTSLTLTNDQAWFPVRLANGRFLYMNLGSSREDTIVDRDLCEQLGHPAGDIGTVKVKGIDLSRYVALRPAELVQVHPDGALGSLGLNLLRHFRLEVDRVNRYLRWTETTPASFPKDDLAYFKAFAEEEAEPLETVLSAYPGSRLAREASEQLLDLLLEQDAARERFSKALVWVDRTRISDLRATESLETMKKLLLAHRPALAIEAGELGVKSGRKDRYPESVHKLHAKLGELMLDSSADDKAWEHLLSAAFGLPEDGRINLLLGRFYEKKKRYKRAMSRYIQAVIQPESGGDAVKGMESVQKAMGGDPLSVDLVDKMIAGKVRNFGAATTFKADKDTDTNRVALVELFQNVHLGQPQAEGWRSFLEGGTMAEEGILSHFPRSRVAVLTYHLPTPELSATVTALGIDMAQLYGEPRPGYFCIDGMSKAKGFGRWRDAEGLYEGVRRRVVRSLEESSDHTIHLESTIDGDRIDGEVKIQGPAREGAHVQLILYERGVLYPGKGLVVVHRNLARARLTEKFEGLPFQVGEKGFSYRFSASLKDLQKQHERYLTVLEGERRQMATRLSTRIDPRQVGVTAILRGADGREVLQCAQVASKLVVEDKR